MSKQLMIYERAVPVSAERHRDWSIQAGRDFSFAKDVNSVPVLAAEFPSAGQEMAIVFAGEGEATFPAVILGVRPDENNHIASDGSWTGGYIPAFLRRYPFVFSQSDDGKTFTLCMDEEFSGANQDGKGERLFDTDGNPTQYIQSQLGFAQEYQTLFSLTRQFCNRLIEHDLLEQGQANFTLPGGATTQLGGFQIISRSRLKALPPELLAEMAKTDELEMCYIHLQSLSNLTPMTRRVTEAGNEAAKETA